MYLQLSFYFQQKDFRENRYRNVLISGVTGAGVDDQDLFCFVVSLAGTQYCSKICFNFRFQMIEVIQKDLFNRLNDIELLPQPLFEIVLSKSTIKSFAINSVMPGNHW
jgi:archaellum biogenesis protein FlaJ (TadC family)